MIRILANDGIEADGQTLLEEAGYEVVTDKIAQEDLPSALNQFDAIIVRSATKVRKDLIDACPNLKLIARGGVGMDNIDVDYARGKGIHVINTPAASSRSVAELVFAHILSLTRYLYDANRRMPLNGSTQFKQIKKEHSAGRELEGKTLGILGCGRIGREVAKIALGMGMRVLPVDPKVDQFEVSFRILQAGDFKLSVDIDTVDMEKMLAGSDFITVHVPGATQPLMGSNELAKMKPGSIVINTSRGGIIDEDALLAALDSGHLAGAGLDVFKGEPSPDERVLKHPHISLSPHTGASTVEAQTKIGLELAEQIIDLLGEDHG